MDTSWTQVLGTDNGLRRNLKRKNIYCNHVLSHMTFSGWVVCAYCKTVDNVVFSVFKIRDFYSIHLLLFVLYAL